MDIDERTRIPLFAVLVSLPVFLGGILWLTAIDTKASNAEASNQRQDEKIEESQKLLLDIRERVIRIEEKLDHEKK